MKEQELMERYITEAYPNGNVLELFQEVISQEKEKSFKAGLERAEKRIASLHVTTIQDFGQVFMASDVMGIFLEEARELKEGE